MDVKEVKEDVKSSDLVNEKLLEEVKSKKKVKVGVSNDKKIMISIIGIVMIIALGIFGWFYYNNNLKPVATFDGGSLTTSEYSIYYKTFAPMLEYYGYSAESIPGQIAEKAVVDKIMLLKAEEEGVSLSDEDRASVDEIFSNEEEIESFVAQGIDPNKMKELYYNDYTITAYIEKIKTDLTDEEVTSYLKETYGEDIDMTEYVTRHILFLTVDANTNEPLDDESKAEVKAKAETALARALSGEDFISLVSELSEDTGTKEEGGLYNVYLDENTVSQYKDAVLELEVGSITTALVESDYGYHIIKLEEKNDSGRVNSDYDRSQLADKKIEEMSENMDMKIDEIVLNSVVESITGVKSEEDTEEENTEIIENVESTENTEVNE